MGIQERGRLWKIALYFGLVSDRSSAQKRAQMRRRFLPKRGD